MKEAMMLFLGQSLHRQVSTLLRTEFVHSHPVLFISNWP